MKKLVLSVLLFLSLICISHAEQRGDEWKLRWNYQEKEWVYAPENWKLKWNWQEKRWQFAPKNSRLKWNHMEKRWEFVPRGGEGR